MAAACRQRTHLSLGAVILYWSTIFKLQILFSLMSRLFFACKRPSASVAFFHLFHLIWILTSSHGSTKLLHLDPIELLRPDGGDAVRRCSFTQVIPRAQNISRRLERAVWPGDGDTAAKRLHGHKYQWWCHRCHFHFHRRVC